MFKKVREFVRSIVITIRYFFLVNICKMDIDKTARISYGAILDKAYSKGVHIGAETYIASGAIIFAHDFCRGLHQDTYIGKQCFIGANAIVMCGITLGDHVVVGAGAIVTHDVPSNSIVAGNPARVIKSGVRTTQFGKIL